MFRAGSSSSRSCGGQSWIRGGVLAWFFVLLSLGVLTPAASAARITEQQLVQSPKFEPVVITLERHQPSIAQHKTPYTDDGGNTTTPNAGTFEYYEWLQLQDRKKLRRRGFVKDEHFQLRELMTVRDLAHPQANVLEQQNRSFTPLSLVNMGDLQYYTKIQLGSGEQQDLNVQVDTGSDLFWVYCTDTLGKAEPGTFNVAASSTATLLLCPNPDCSNRKLLGGNASCRTGESQACHFEADYADKSGISGYLVKDQLTLAGQVTGSVVIGCGTSARGSLANHTGNLGNGPDGLLGLARPRPGSPLPSIHEPLTSEGAWARGFSLCLASAGPGKFGTEGVSTGGSLSLGDVRVPEGAQSVEMVGTGLFYVPLVDIAVGGKPLGLDPATITYDGTVGATGPGVVIDSGFSLGNLPGKTFDLFLESVSHSATGLGLHRIFDLPDFPCYASNASSSSLDWFRNSTPFLPTADLLFPNNVSFHIPRENLYLLTVLPNNKPALCALISRTVGVQTTVIGDTWLRNNWLTFDLERQLISFVPMDCSLPLSSPPATKRSGGTANHVSQQEAFFRALVSFMVVLLFC